MTISSAAAELLCLPFLCPCQAQEGDPSRSESEQESQSRTKWNHTETGLWWRRVGELSFLEEQDIQYEILYEYLCTVQYMGSGKLDLENCTVLYSPVPIPIATALQGPVRSGASAWSTKSSTVH
jgi:hypothetical protein